VDDVPAMLDILDTAGPEEYSAMSESYYRMGEGFIFVYSITDRRSFDKIAYYLQQVKQVRSRSNGSNGSMILVGNKIDLEDERAISYEEGKNFAKDCNIPVFMECSAKTGQNVSQIFTEITRLCRIAKQHNQTTPTPNASKKCKIM
jgi:small GTP-binding protein